MCSGISTRVGLTSGSAQEGARFKLKLHYVHAGVTPAMDYLNALKSASTAGQTGLTKGSHASHVSEESRNR